MANEKAAAAKTALDNDANNETLKKAKADADAAVVKATEDVKKATDAKTEQDKKIADAAAALAAAHTARDKGAREEVRVARGGTIVWGGNPAAQLTGHSRLARSVTLAVLKETAPYQLTTDVARFSVNQGSQIVLPFKLLKRAGFDNPVNLTFVTPPPNLLVENKPIAKGAADGLYRLFVNNNVAPGTALYTARSKPGAQSPTAASRKRPQLAAKEEEVTTTRRPSRPPKLLPRKRPRPKTAADKKEAAGHCGRGRRRPPTPRSSPTKLAVDTAAEAKKAADAKVVADKLAVDSAAEAKAAADAKVVADKLRRSTRRRRRKLLVDAAAKGRKKALDKDANNETLKKAKADADALVVKELPTKPRRPPMPKSFPTRKRSTPPMPPKKPLMPKSFPTRKRPIRPRPPRKAADAKVVSDKAAVDTDALAKKAAEEKAAAGQTGRRNRCEIESRGGAPRRGRRQEGHTTRPTSPNPQNINASLPGGGRHRHGENPLRGRSRWRRPTVRSSAARRSKSRRRSPAPTALPVRSH